MFENIVMKNNKKYFLLFFIILLVVGISLLFVFDLYKKANQVSLIKNDKKNSQGKVLIENQRDFIAPSPEEIERIEELRKAAELGDLNAMLVVISWTLFSESSKEMDQPKIKKYLDLLGKNKYNSGVDFFNICEYNTFEEEYPEEDVPTKDEIKELNKYCYYYEDQNPKNDAEKQELKIALRKCLLAPETTGNSLSLGEIYANGWGGVKVNLKLAIAIFCSDQKTKYTLREQLEWLFYTLTMGLKKGKLDHELIFCDIVDSHSKCTDQIVRVADAQREKREKALVAKFSKNEKRAYDKLKKMTESFTMNQWELEPKDLFLNAYSQMVEAQSNLNNYLINQLEKFEEKKIFSTDDDFKDADAELNKVYKEIMKIKNDDHFINGITKQGIKKTQRSWIAFRDALDEFCIIRYPQINKNQCNTIVTRQRVMELNDLLNPPEQEDPSS